MLGQVCILCFASAVLLMCSATAESAQIILPQGRQAYYANEQIEIAVSGLPEGASATIQLSPQEKGSSNVDFPVQGDGSTVTLVIPENTFAPGNYIIKLDGNDAGKITISSGIVDSRLYLSQTIGWDQLKPAGSNFIVGNAFSFGRFTPDSKEPITTGLRSSRSSGIDTFERAVAMDLPTLVYMYWTGYVTHKPFGSQKSWVNPDEIEAMRLLSFHTAQRLRRFSKNIIAVGTIDEPGLGWGKTPTGGTASGFPDWDETAWYESRGWKFTDDPASRPDDDWMKYMTIRCAILRESNEQAKKDLRTVWSDFVFSTDLYATHAIMDGTDPLNQKVNDIPSTHIFTDWGIDRLGVYSGIMLEKSHAPYTKVAHAMNGQLFGDLVPQPNLINAYRVTLNGLMAAGLFSNWWLNTGGMTPADLAKVNNPAKKVGAMLKESHIQGHDVAVLWSFTEMSMRQKDMSAKEAKKSPGGKITMTVTDLPENSAIKSKVMDINAYNIGGDYKESILTAHYALSRAGYPAHIIHERMLPSGVLRDYKTLAIIGQTFPLPPDIMKAINDFTKKGGKILVDQSTTVKFDGAIIVPINLKGLSYRWSALFLEDAKNFKTLKEASYYQTNFFMDKVVRDAVIPFKETMKKTMSKPVLETDSDELVVERRKAGDGSIVLIINGYEQLPEIKDNEKYLLYNFAPHKATYQLKNIEEGSIAYIMEGSDWSKMSKIDDPASPITADFEPGEMKVYVIVPYESTDFYVSAKEDNGSIFVECSFKDLKMPLPLTVTIKKPSGEVLYEAYRSTEIEGFYEERFPLGFNAINGMYTIKVDSPLAGMSGEAKIDFVTHQATANIIPDKTRVLDAETIKSFLSEKPDLTIAFGNDANKVTAEKLAGKLSAKGLKVSVKSEELVLRKVKYPRVWNPYAKVYYSIGDENLGDKKVSTQITLSTDKEGVITIKTSDGKEFDDWRQPNSLVTIGGEGYVDYLADVETCFSAGVKLYFDEQRRMTVIKGQPKEEKTDDQFKAKWAKPWSKLMSHVGAYQLPPQLPEAWTADSHLILLGDSTTSKAIAVIQASDLLLQVVDSDYPGKGKALISFVWSPFAVEKNVIIIGSSDEEGLNAGADHLAEILMK
jgi:hypothetical protein